MFSLFDNALASAGADSKQGKQDIHKHVCLCDQSVIAGCQAVMPRHCHVGEELLFGAIWARYKYRPLCFLRLLLLSYLELHFLTETL